MKIAVDFDNTIVDSSEFFIEIYNKKYKKNIIYEDINKWNYWGEEAFQYIYPKACKRIYEYKLINEFIPNYLFILNREHDVDILTKSRVPLPSIKKRLKQLGIEKGNHYNKIIKTETKKVEFEYDLFIDDNPQMVNDIQEFSNKYLLLFNCPWNYKTTMLQKNVFRLYGWSDLFDKIKMIKCLIE